MKSPKKLNDFLFMGLLTIGSVSFANSQSGRWRDRLDYVKNYAQALKNIEGANIKLLNELYGNIEATQNVFLRIITENRALVEKLEAAGESEFARHVSEFRAEKIDEVKNDLIDLKSEIDSLNAEDAPVSAKTNALRDHLTLFTADVDEWKELNRTIKEALEEINARQEKEKREEAEMLRREEEDAAGLALSLALAQQLEEEAQQMQQAAEDEAEAIRIVEQLGEGWE